MRKIILKNVNKNELDGIIIVLFKNCEKLNVDIINRNSLSELMYTELMILEISVMLCQRLTKKRDLKQSKYKLNFSVQESICLIQAFLTLEKTNSITEFQKYLSNKIQEKINKQLIDL